MGITEAEKKQLDEQGCIVIPDVLSDEEIEVYRADILRLAEEEKQNGLARQHTDGHGQHVRWLVNKGEMYEKLVARPTVMPYFEHLLGPDYTLSTLTSNIIDPGAPDGGYHVDSVLGSMPEPLPSFPLVANSLWLLDDFTPENGGTRHVPGIHLQRIKPPPGTTHHPDEVRVSAPKGSVFLFKREFEKS